jgi:hypothetical protein
MEVDEVPIEGDVAPFPREDGVMIIYDRHPSLERRHVPNPSVRTPACCSRGGVNVEM